MGSAVPPADPVGTLPIVRCVTFVQRAGRSMSHPFRAFVPWHKCCSYIPISGSTAAFGKQASQGIYEETPGLEQEQ